MRIVSPWCRFGCPVFIELVVFALMKAGGVGGLIDPGMEPKYLVNCLSEINPMALSGFRKPQANPHVVTTSVSPRHCAKRDGRTEMVFLGRGRTLDLDHRNGASRIDALQTVTERRTEAAVISPLRQHRNLPKESPTRTATFHAQIDNIADRYEFVALTRPGVFPFVRFVRCGDGRDYDHPDMDPTRPARRRSAETDLPRCPAMGGSIKPFGSPALWRTVTRWVRAKRGRSPVPGRCAPGAVRRRPRGPPRRWPVSASLRS